MTDLLSKARNGRLAALEQRNTTDLIRDAVLRSARSRTAAVIPFQSRRGYLVA
jgi:hypothetical protein